MFSFIVFNLPSLKYDKIWSQQKLAYCKQPVIIPKQEATTENPLKSSALSHLIYLDKTVTTNPEYSRQFQLNPSVLCIVDLLCVPESISIICLFVLI